MKILILSAEAVPYAKVGGLGDVMGALPKALHAMGHDVRLVIPRYGRIDPHRFGLTPTLQNLQVPHDNSTLPTTIMEGKLEGGAPIYVVDEPQYFGRDGIYGYEDDGERFIFFCRAAMEMLKQLNWQPDILHCNDWHTGIVPNWLRTLYRDDPFFANTASVFTIHNLQYQGIYGMRILEVAGVAEHGFIYHPQMAELNEVVDLMARGILFADVITTVSERYAQEILTPEFGEKLDAILRDRKERLFGILNGIDDVLFDPANDKHIVARYSLHNLAPRAEDKAALQREARLPVEPHVPIIGMISRLSEQKGIDLLGETIDHIMDLHVQFVLLGTGDQQYHELFTRVAETYPEKAAVFLTFNTELAQKIYAGSDMFLMPSRFEPCGLSQMIAMRYGSVPIVRATGGLADTVADWRPETATGNGFVFHKVHRWDLFAAIVRALETYRYQDVWRKIQANGMKGDYSWRRSAERYVEIYQKAQQFKAADKQKAAP